jgi:hypothetical protein
MYFSDSLISYPVYIFFIILKDRKKSGSSVGMIMVQLKESLRQSSESKIATRSSF